MKTLSLGEYRALSEFFNTIAAAWFTGGIVAPFFAKLIPSEKLIFAVSGSLLSYFFLNISLYFARGGK